MNWTFLNHIIHKGCWWLPGATSVYFIDQKLFIAPLKASDTQNIGHTLNCTFLTTLPHNIRPVLIVTGLPPASLWSSSGRSDTTIWTHSRACWVSFIIRFPTLWIWCRMLIFLDLENDFWRLLYFEERCQHFRVWLIVHFVELGYSSSQMTLWADWNLGLRWYLHVESGILAQRGCARLMLTFVLEVELVYFTIGLDSFQSLDACLKSFWESSWTVLQSTWLSSWLDAV